MRKIVLYAKAFGYTFLVLYGGLISAVAGIAIFWIGLTDEDPCRGLGDRIWAAIAGAAATAFTGIGIAGLWDRMLYAWDEANSYDPNKEVAKN